MDNTKWIIDPAEDAPLAVIEDTEEGMGIAEICPHKYQEANAKLIASAPELLLALTKIAQKAKEWETEGRDRPPFWNLGDIALAAIKKAGQK